jgi:suppressor for copper-sensitivity B
MQIVRPKLLIGVLLVFAAPSAILLAQTAPGQSGSGFAAPGLEDLGGFGGLGDFGQEQKQPVQVEARIEAQPGIPVGRLVVTATVEDPYHIFSISQPRGGPQPTKIRIKPNAEVRVGEWETTTPPKIHIDDGPWKGLPIEEHYGRVEWVAPLEFAAGADPANVMVEGVVDTQACDPSVCIPLTLKFAAGGGTGSSESRPAAPPRGADAADLGRFTQEGAQASLSGYIEPATVAPGGEATLVLTLTPKPGWHAYALADVEPKKGNKSTLIVTAATEGLQIGQASTNSEVLEKEPDVPEILKWPTVRYHRKGPVTWTVPIRVDDSTASGIRTVDGIIGYQVCQESGQCDFPRAARFQGTFYVDTPASDDGKVPLTFTAASYADAAKAAASRAEGKPIELPTMSRSAGRDTSPLPPGGPPSEGPAPGADAVGFDLGKLELREVTLTTSAKDAASLGSLDDASTLYYLAIAFLGGLILNLMPCVLPVIGLKVMSFVQQAGHSRSQALALNIWYSAGIVIVFLALAGLAVGAGLGWGDQFSSVWFNVALASLVFAMALSLLGVWEIPIPGFVGGSTASQLVDKEGPTGAFTKGVFTTILATPCTGPFMASALGWAVQQPAETTFATFGAMGLGMASPYLVIGAFPSLVRFLPKPGNWMVTFKQVMGFILLGTVVFILSFMPPASVVPTVALLAGIGLACWWVSRIPATADTSRKLSGWLIAGAVAGAIGWISFGWLYQDVLEPRLAEKQKTGENERARAELETVLGQLRAAEGEEALASASALVQQRLAAIDSGEYQAFSLDKLQRFAAEEGRTVLVDFTADWCLTCQVFEAAVLHSDPVEKALAAQDVVTMKADYTDKPENLARVLRALDSNGVPVVAVFPGNDPYRPFVFRGGYTKAGILTALRQAREAPPSASPAGQRSSVVAALPQDGR